MSAVPPTRHGGDVSDVERFVLDFFRSKKAVTVSRQALLDAATQYAHADVVRAIASLESRHRLLYRFAHGSQSWVTLTKKGLKDVLGADLDRRKPSRGEEPPELIYEHPHPVRATDGNEYNAVVMGVGRLDGTWSGWIEFSEVDGERRLRTEQETNQPNRDALEYWATGVEDVYLEGALPRARAVSE